MTFIKVTLKSLNKEQIFQIKSKIFLSLRLFVKKNEFTWPLLLWWSLPLKNCSCRMIMQKKSRLHFHFIRNMENHYLKAFPRDKLSCKRNYVSLEKTKPQTLRLLLSSVYKLLNNDKFGYHLSSFCFHIPYSGYSYCLI